jgi:adenylyltransferase/sulfurtransferase
MLTVVDVWEGTFRRMNVAGLREKSDCPACVQGRRDWLRGDRLSQSTVLCGRNAVQVTPSQKTSLSLSEVASRLAGAGAVSHNEYLLRLTLPGEQAQITLFPDGRAIIKGTDDVSAARALYARYVGV